MPEDSNKDFDTVTRIVRMLEPLDNDRRAHIINTVETWLQIEQPSVRTDPTTFESIFKMPRTISANSNPANDNIPVNFSARDDIPPKDFLLHKDPRTDVERLACLAYYLKHYRDKPHFKTLDLSVLNTEAAQRKLSNPTVATNNAARDGFFVPSSRKGSRQLSAMGERFVQELPDRSSAQTIRQRMKRPRRVTPPQSK